MEVVSIDQKLVDKLVSDFTKKLSKDQGIGFLKHLKYSFSNGKSIPVDEFPGGNICHPCAISGKVVTTTTKIYEFLDKFNKLVDEFNSSEGVVKEVALSNQQKLIKKTSKCIINQSYGNRSKSSDLIICNEVIIALDKVVAANPAIFSTNQVNDYSTHTTYRMSEGYTDKLKLVLVDHSGAKQKKSKK